MIRLFRSLMIAMFATAVEANEISGPAKAVDSTVIEINGQRIMLFGIDSVMRKQNCTLGGKIWQCWAAAVRELEILLDQGPATCEMMGEPDVYGRLLARCTINSQSLNEQLVRRATPSHGPARRRTMSRPRPRPGTKKSACGVASS